MILRIDETNKSHTNKKLSCRNSVEALVDKEYLL